MAKAGRTLAAGAALLAGSYGVLANRETVARWEGWNVIFTWAPYIDRRDNSSDSKDRFVVDGVGVVCLGNGVVTITEADDRNTFGEALPKSTQLTDADGNLISWSAGSIAEATKYIAEKNGRSLDEVSPGPLALQNAGVCVDTDA